MAHFTFTFYRDVEKNGTAVVVYAGGIFADYTTFCCCCGN